MTDALTTLQPAEYGRALTKDQLVARLATIQSVMRHVMQEGVDYGVIPGTDKPTLYKPGAEKLCVTFRLAATQPAIEQIPELSGDIRYRVSVPIMTADGTVVAVGVGECSSGEEKYRWRRPVHAHEFEAAPEDQRRVKWQRNGDSWNQVRVNPADVANTILKMAHKRAYIHGVIMATAAGAIFTQDIEDMPEGTVDDEHEARPARTAIKAPQRKAATPSGAGSTVTVSVLGIVSKDGVGNNGPWTKWTVSASDRKNYGTFDAEMARIAEDAKRDGVAVEIAYAEGKYGRDIQAIARAEREVGAEG
jgi:hypothetical protein